MIHLCTRCGEPYCTTCNPEPFDFRNVCEDCLNAAEPDPDLERKARLEAGL